MKLEKMLKTMVLSSALLVLLSAAAGAAETAVLSADALPAVAATEAAPAPATVDSNCDRADSAPLFQVSFEKGSESFAQTCGTCSTANCRGANRGQMCWTGGVQGQWGNCNIYSGGNWCAEGGWECQCGVGPLP